MNYVKRVKLMKGLIGELLLGFLEMCLDNIVYCLGFVLIIVVVC